MADILQTQKSFAYGQTGLTGFSNITDFYHHSCKKLENTIVNKNGSVRVRGGWQDIGLNFPLKAKTKLRDVFQIEGNFILWLEPDGAEAKNAGLYIYDQTMRSLSKMKFRYDGSYVYSEKFKKEVNLPFSEAEAFRGHGLDNFHPNTEKIVNVAPFEDFLCVFFENCYPYVIKADEGVVLTAPYWHGVGEDNIWKAFPFGYTAIKKTIGSFYHRDVGKLNVDKGQSRFYPALNQQEQLRLRLKDVNIAGKECGAWLEPTEDNQPSGLFVDKKYISLGKFIGRPIAFQTGARDFTVRQEIPDPEDGQPAENTPQQNLAREAYNFYVIFPYQIVNPARDNDTDRYISWGKEMGNIRKGRYYAKCKIYEIGSKLSIFASNDLSARSGQRGGSADYRTTEEYVISDWADGWPKSGGVLEDKYFFFTSKSKLSFSKTNDPFIWGNPIKSLLKVPRYNLVYLEGTERPTEEQADDGEGVKYTSILREDFLAPSKAILDLFKVVEEGRDALETTVADALTYRLEDKNGRLIDVRKHHIVSVGVLTSGGIQCVFLSDKGAFYWGFAPGEQNFFRVANVSNFIGGEDSGGHDYGIVEVLSKLFATSEDNELHKVNYDPNNRNFIAEPVGMDRGFKGFVHGENFIGNRLLFIDRIAEKMYCCNVSNEGNLMGVSEWVIHGWTPKGVWKFGTKYYGAFQNGSNLRILEYGDTEQKDGVSKTGVDIEAVVETAPLTWVKKFGSDPCLHLKKALNRMFFYVEGGDISTIRNNLEVCPRTGISFSVEERNTRNRGQFGVVSVKKSVSLDEGQGLCFKFKKPLVVSGVVIYLTAST